MITETCSLLKHNTARIQGVFNSKQYGRESVSYLNGQYIVNHHYLNHSITYHQQYQCDKASRPTRKLLNLKIASGKQFCNSFGHVFNQYHIK